MDSPLDWKGVHHCLYDLEANAATIFLLRDHMFLMQDIITDWNARPAPDFVHFLPYEYALNFSFVNCKLYLCVNEQNIISQPNNLEDNGMYLL